jgi:catechol 2,3-dioxygenase-like lactoylglutathione lyase family enzyme
VIPTLRISNYTKSKAFYIDQLGFTIDWEHRFRPDFPVFAQITRDKITLFLTEHRGDCAPGALVHIFVRDVDAWHAEFQRQGATITPPDEQLQGVRAMTVTDPDGNKLCFFTRLPHWKRDRAS